MESFVDVEKTYKENVLDIWKKYNHLRIFDSEEFYYRKHPLLPKKVKKNSLMFIGINPSFTKRSIIPADMLNIGFYEEKKDEKKDIPYFEKIKEVAKYCNHNWTHLDLFFLRETNQKVIEKLSYSNVSFLTDQLDISFDIIERAQPKLIIVANAFASEFFGKLKSKHGSLKSIWKSFNLNFEKSNGNFNHEIGTYEILLNNIKTPILFSGMLSGQRALDIGSFERLKWQAKMILNKK